MSFSSTPSPSASGITSNPFLSHLKKINSLSSAVTRDGPPIPRTRPSIDLASTKSLLFQDTIGFSTLPDQIHRKTLKRGFEFTLMVVGTYKKNTLRLFINDTDLLVGEHGLGKSTFINTLFMTELYADRPASARRKDSFDEREREGGKADSALFQFIRRKQWRSKPERSNWKRKV